jgi:ribosomal protein S13
MREGKKVNGVFLYTSNSLRDFFFKSSSYGFSKKLLGLLHSRLETRIDKKIKEFSVPKMFVVYNILLNIVPQDRELRKKVIFNVFMLDLINSYRGLRHSFGLPTRGQRTWTNAWSVYRSNLLLRQFKIKLSKRLYTTITINELNIAYLAEQINSL